MKKHLLRLLLVACLLPLLSACASSGSSSLMGVPVRVDDLTGQIGTIVNAEFDFIGRMGAPGRGGEVCCASLPQKWYPGMIATVRWVKDPAPTFDFPIDPKKFAEFEKRQPPYEHHSAQVELLPYTRTCGVTMVFLPCDQVRVTIDCDQEGPLVSKWSEEAAAQKGKTCPKHP